MRKPSLEYSKIRCVLLFSLLFQFTSFRPEAAEGIREFDQSVSALVYDPFTQKLYGAATNQLLQFDPDSGQVLGWFDIGSRITRMALGAGHGIWIGVENAVLRFNLETLSTEDPVFVPGTIIDVAPSASDPYTVAVSTPRISGRWETARIIRNGAALPDTYQANNLVLNGSFIFLGNVRMGIGPNGIVVPGYQGVPFYAAGRMQSLSNYVYSASGSYWDATSLTAPDKTSRSSPWYAPSTLAVNPQDNSVYFLTDTGTSWDLNRREHRTFKHTGHFRLPRYEPESNMIDRSLVAWSTNRVAFHTSTKLYILETDKLFLPADLAFSQAPSRAAIDIGTNTFFNLSITNHGPGAALEVVLTNLISSGIVFWQNPSIPSKRETGSLITHFFDTLQPGASVEFSIQVIPLELGSVRSEGNVVANNDLNPANNIAQTSASILRPADQVTEMMFAASDLAWNSLHRKLYFATGGGVMAYDLITSQILGSGHYFPRIETAPTDGTVYGVNRFGTLHRIDPFTFEPTGIFTVGQTVFDIAVSPTNSNLYAVSDQFGTSLVTANGRLGNLIPEQGNAEFSADGTELYFVDSGVCALSVFSVGPDGLTLQRSANFISCSGFTVANGLLYFDSGGVYDPLTLQKRTNSLSLPPPTFVIPRPNGTRDLLNRTNGVWTLRRLHDETLATLASVQIPPFAGTPFEMVPAGPNRVAVRTSSSDASVYIIAFESPPALAPQLTASSNGSGTLAFHSIVGTTYRIESSPTLGAPIWTMVRDAISGTGQPVTEPISISGTAMFYRVSTVP